MEYEAWYLKKRADELNLVLGDNDVECEFCDNPRLGRYYCITTGHEYKDVEYVVCGYCLATGFDRDKQEIKPI